MAPGSTVLRYPSRCTSCSAELAKGSSAHWDRQAKTATCTACARGEEAVEAGAPEPSRSEPAPVARGTAGASARREYERRAARERRRQEALVAEDEAWREKAKAAHPIVGRIASAITAKPVIEPESQSTTAWRIGAVGEERVAQWLDGVPGILALHDRRVPGSRANIDHIVIASSGVHVIDAKRYRGLVERRDVGSFFRPDERLFVGRRDCTKLAKSVVEQSALVAAAIGTDVPVHAGLCFVDAEWSLFGKPFHLGTSWVGWPKAMARWVSRSGSLDESARKATGRRLAEVFRPA